MTGLIQFILFLCLNYLRTCWISKKRSFIKIKLASIITKPYIHPLPCYHNGLYYKPIIVSSCCMQLVIVIIVQCLNTYVDKPLGNLMINTRNKLNPQLIILCRITYWSYISHNSCKDYNLSKLLYISLSDLREIILKGQYSIIIAG